MNNLDIMNNWQHIPENKRSLCISHLQHKLSPYSLNKLREELNTKGYIDFPDYVFSMHVKSLLRNVLPDNELPIILQSDPSANNPNGQNWSDFFLGALTDAVKK